MPEQSIYEAFPYLERDWEGMSHSKAAEYSQIEDWYHSRLLNVTGPVCELGCGYGRLLVNLARSGIEVHGTDVAVSRVNAARQHYKNLGIKNAHFHHCQMPSVPQGIRFGAVVMATNAIGYIHSDSDKRTLLANIFAVLDDDGVLLMDHRRGSMFMKLLRSWPGLRGNIGSNQATMKSRLNWSVQDDGIRESFMLQDVNNQQRVFSDLFRFDSAGRTLNRLRYAGFRIEETCGTYAGTPSRPWSTMLAVAAKRERRDVLEH